MDRVVAITVTYNDAEYLIKCVSSLLKQTYQVDKVIVVDNNSNEKNAEILSSISDSKVFILKLDENLGGAGGFQKGMEYARDNCDPDWYWLMDADAYPCEDCLEKLLAHKNDRENIGFLAPLIYGVDLNQFQLYHHKKLAKFLERDLALYTNYSEIPDVSDIIADAFVGPLFSKAAIEKVGIADGELFIYGDDLEYTYRVTRKFEALLIKDAVINHRDQPAINGIQQPKNWWKDYYMYRNRLLFIDKYHETKVKKLIGNFLTWLRVFKQFVLNVFRNKGELRKLRAKILHKAIDDGFKHKKGKSLDPSIYISMVNKLS